MDAKIDRLLRLPSMTLGSLYLREERIDGKKLESDWIHQCFTKEPPEDVEALRAGAAERYISGESALPLGTYNVVLEKARRFSRVVPTLYGSTMPGPGALRVALGMRFIPGHYTLDTLGGIVVGEKQGPKDVHLTREAFDKLVARWTAVKERGERIELVITSLS